jgi:sporulation protein YlmC with PRC-barrel domain
MRSVIGLVVASALAGLPFSGAVAQQTQAPPQPTQGSQEPTPQQQPAQGPSGSPGAPASGGSVQIASDSLVGTKVRDAEGKDIGAVSKLLIDARNGKVTSVIISRGGTLGMGAKEMSVPWEALKLQRGQDQQLVVTMEQPILDRAPQTEQDKDRQPAASPPARQEGQPRQR